MRGAPPGRALAIAILACFCASAALAQSIVTIAGGGPIGDGRRATEATLKLPQHVAFDTAGNLFIADTTNHRVRRVDAQTGLISTIAGGGSGGFRDGERAVGTELVQPSRIAVDRGGNVFVLEASSGTRLRRIDAVSGIITTYAGGGNSNPGDGGFATSAVLGSVIGMTVDRDGNLFLAEGGARIRRIDAKTGIINTVAGGRQGYDGDNGPATSAAMRPNDVAVDADGNLFVSEATNNRIRRVDAKTKVITTIAGTGVPENIGENGPAISASVKLPQSLTMDSSGNLYFVVCCYAVQKIDSNGVLTRYAGTGTEGFGGDNGPAVNARFAGSTGLGIDPAGNLFLADARNQRVRKVTAATGVISTVAGGGPTGDGGAATSAQLFAPVSIALDESTRTLYIADQGNYRIRKVSLDTGIISTVAGAGDDLPDAPGDGGLATAASFLEPLAVTLDSARNLYFSHRLGQVRKVDRQTGIITTVAGMATAGYSGDNGLAIQAMLNYPTGITFDKDDNLYIVDQRNHLVRKVTARTGIITRVAGVAPPEGPAPNPPVTGGYSGDGDLATRAQLHFPTDVAIDAAGNVYVSDTSNRRVRKIEVGTGVIITFAGGGNALDGNPANQAFVGPPRGVWFDANGNLLFMDSTRIRRVDARTNFITSLPVGNGRNGFSGDGGPAEKATLSPAAKAITDAAGNLFLADTNNNRIRAVYACVGAILPPPLTAPADNSAGLTAPPALRWNAVQGGFRYDVYVDTVSPPKTLVAQDLTATTYPMSNLSPGVKYYWRVVVKTDPLCSTLFVNASSAVFSFTMAAGCPAPQSFSTTAPANGATNVGTPAQLSWQAASGASVYDVSFGTSSPPPVVAGGVVATTYNTPPLAANTTYYWNVIAHASCDVSRTTATPVQSFRVAGNCAGASAFNLGLPGNGAKDVALTTTLTWSASAGAAAYDLYLGTSSPPPAYLLDLSKTSLPVSGLFAGRTYSWRVVAKVPCDPTKNASTSIATFTTTASGCPVPPATAITFVPPGNVGAGQTYSISWRDLTDLDADGFYIVERALDPSFAIAERQETFATSASFVSAAPGTYYHRVRAVRGCDPLRPGAASAPGAVTVVAGSPNVVFTVQPQAVVTALADPLEDRKSTFVLENLGSLRLQVILGKGEINSAPFFTITDPFGGDSVFVTLEPKQPKTFEIRFSGPANDEPGSYQGIVFVASTGQGLTITPYAFINLKVGGGPTLRPVFTLQGRPTEFAAFAPHAGDDATRAPLSVDLRNDGESPMEVAGEVAPEVWLVPESGWNALSIAPRTSRTIRFRTQRSRAPNGSALPRYTYFTVRSRNGQTARLLIQDNDAPLTGSGRPSLLGPGSRSFIVPHVIGTATSFTRLRLTNVGGTSVQTELYFTPTGSDGFDGFAVKRATIVVPPNDVVTLIDPLAQIFGLARPADGSVEVRTAAESFGSLIVSSSVFTPNALGGGFGYEVPTFLLGEGARLGANQSIAGVSADTGTRATLLLTETSGLETTRVRVVLYDKAGARKGDTAVDVPRYGRRSIADVVKALSGLDSLDRGRIDVVVESGGGAIAAFVTLLDASNGNGATLVAQPVAGTSTPRLQAGAASRMRWALSASPTTVAPVVVNGDAFPVPNAVFRTSVGLTTTGTSKVTAVVTYRDSAPGSAPVSRTLELFPGLLLHFDNVLEELFGVATGAKAYGSVFIESGVGSQIYAQLFSKGTSATRWGIAANLPLLPTVSDVLTSLTSRRPLYLDGLEQSIDSSRGTKWIVILNEIAGSTGTVSVRLYESGNRSVPIAERTMPVAAFEQMRLDVFPELGLDSDERRKDRTNVLCVISAASGSAMISASAVAIDNRTGDTRTYTFSPNGGVPATGVSRVSVVTPVPATPRRRLVKP